MIKIAHLYPEELNLYGENGNIKALIYALKMHNLAYEITNINKENKLDFKKYDFIYIGSGRPKFLEAVKERLKPYKEDILDYITKNKIFLVTGNAISIFTFLELYEVKLYKKRLVSDVLATSSLCPGVIKGFQNTEYLINSTNSLLFNIEQGYGNQDTQLEGYVMNNFYATSIIGPILARNDNLTQYFINLFTSN